MNSLLILNSSIIIKKPILSFDNIKIEYGKKRIDSYKSGFTALAEFKIYNNFNSVVLIDNTVKKISSLPQDMLSLLPKNTEFLLRKKNKVGRKNKGAGMLEALKFNKEFFEKYDKVFYFEPRLVIKSDSFIQDFISDNSNYFSLESHQRVKSGYFGSISKDLIEFVDKFDTKQLIDKNLHIENIMYDFYAQKNTQFKNIEISNWKNYLSNLYEPY